MSNGRVFVLGAGMAGLAAATALAEAGRFVTVVEAAPRAGGRCRSFKDPQLGVEINNGNHLVLSGNVDTMRYLERIGAAESIDVLAPEFPFRDLATGETWTVTLGAGRIPWWVFSKARRVPGTGLMDYWRSRAILDAHPESTVAGVLSGTGMLYERFWKPFAVAVLNTEPERAAACLLAPVLRETLLQGGGACRPVLAKRGLGNSFVEPALGYLALIGSEVRLASRCRALTFEGGRVGAIVIDEATVPLDPEDAVISALPPGVAGGLLPGLQVPGDFRAIVNAHFKLDDIPKAAPITGLIGGLAEWLFVRGQVASVTVSAADESDLDTDAGTLATRIWREIAPVMGEDADNPPPYRIVKEKRATIAQTPEMLRLRSKTTTDYENLWLCGDWTDTGLPATIEGAIRSGHQAADAALNR